MHVPQSSQQHYLHSQVTGTTQGLTDSGVDGKARQACTTGYCSARRRGGTVPSAATGAPRALLLSEGAPEGERQVPYHLAWSLTQMDSSMEQKETDRLRGQPVAVRGEEAEESLRSWDSQPYAVIHRKERNSRDPRRAQGGLRYPAMNSLSLSLPESTLLYTRNQHNMANHL